MFLRETERRFIIEKNTLTKLLAFCIIAFILSLVYIIIQMPKEMRVGINPRINEVDSRIHHFEESLMRQNLIRDIELKRHEEMLWSLYQQEGK